MDKKWTPAQSAAMNIRNKTLLVSAAAGSGKTATLTERIIRSLTDSEHPADISKMLIVTFTRAAAEELKNRIFGALSKELAKNPSNAHLTSQLVKLGSARICTIDAFYLELVRSNFSQLGIPASLRIGDSAELYVLKKEIMEEVIDFFYDNDDRFPAFAECFTGTRASNQLSSLFLDLHTSLSSIPEGIQFLKISAEEIRENVTANVDFFATRYGKIVRDRVVDIVSYYLSYFDEECDALSQFDPHAISLLPSFEHDRNFCLSLLDTLKNSETGYESTKQQLTEFKPVALKRLKAEFITDESEAFKAQRKKFHDKLRELRKKYFSQDMETIRRTMEDTAYYTDILYSVLSRFDERGAEEKMRRNVMEFHDVRRLTLRLLVNEDGTPTSVAEQYAKEFTDIYIDEYQDVDPVQDQIFRAISSPTNRFMVGDIKQSIYGFRGAEPQVFSDYRASFPDHTDSNAAVENALTVFMSENFRCDETVINFTNLICSRIFSACTNSIGYRPADDLVFSKSMPEGEYRAPLVEVAVLQMDKEEDTEALGEDIGEDDSEAPEKMEVEAAYIASEIHRLITHEKKADGSSILPGDIAVLFRSRKFSFYLASALRDYGIPSSESDADQYFENPDVLMVLCLLNAIDNPHRDIFMAGTLRSPLFGFSMEDLIRIRQSCDDTYSLYDALLSLTKEKHPLSARCREFNDALTELRRAAQALPVDRFLRTLFESDRFIASGLVNEPTENGEGGNLLRLYEYARTFEAGSFKGLYNFIEYINTIIEEGKKMKLPPKGKSPDRVNLMTIHQSKGLEFPVCFVCGTGGWFNRTDQHRSLLYEYPIGIAMKISDSTGLARINTLMREALSIRMNTRQTEEEMRVLYVALTRARERLYVTAATKLTKEKIMEKAEEKAQHSCRYSLLNCNSYLDWILIPFADANIHTDCCRLSFYSHEALANKLTENETTVDHSISNSLPAEEVINEELYNELKERFSFRYPYADFRRIPAKLTVSRLSPTVLDESDDSAELFDESEERKTTVPDFFLSGKISQSSAAERGTATHLFLQFCDFTNARKKGVSEELARLIEKRFLPQNMADLVYIDELTRFMDSELMDEIIRAEKIIREQRFNIFLSPEQFTEDDSLRELLKGEQVAVQGVMDLVLIDKDGKLLLFDYKTDRLTYAEWKNPILAAKKMNERHGLQLSYYAQAISKLFDRPCDRICVYSTHAGRLFDIDLCPLSIPEKIIDTI